MFFSKKLLLTTLGALSLMMGSLSAKVPANAARIADFRRCFMESEFGKAEQANFKAMQEQMEKSIEELTTQLTAIQERLSNPDVTDLLTTEAIEEDKGKQQTLSGEIQRCQMQFPQILQQAQNQSFYMFREKVKAAASELAEEKKYCSILNEEQAFYYKKELDVTDAVISKLNKKHEEESKKSEKVSSELSKDKKGE